MNNENKRRHVHPVLNLIALAVMAAIYAGPAAAQVTDAPLESSTAPTEAEAVDAVGQDEAVDEAVDESQVAVEQSTGWDVKWTNTFRYSAAFRLKDQDPALVNGPGKNSVNYDDGDSNFDKGLISNRIEVLSELDAVYDNRFGARLSAAGWYDHVYNNENDNPGFAGGAVPNQTSTPYNEFVRSARRLHGRQIEVRDAFVFGRFGDVNPVTVRLGQHALVWGESLFFAANAIAGAQNAFDISRLLADPTAQAKEFVLPVPQVSAQGQFGGVTVAAYYTFDWRENRLPAVGSYFSAADIFGPSAEHMWVGPGVYVNRRDDIAPDNGGEAGISVRWNAFNTDFGVYAIRYHDKTPQLVTTLGFELGPTGPHAVPNGFVQTYHQDATAFGVSASRSFGTANVALEASIRDNASLASSGGTADASQYLAGLKAFLTMVGAPDAAFIPVLPASDGEDHPAYAVGRTAHVNLNTIWTPAPNALFNESIVVAEIAWNRVLRCEKHCAPENGNPQALDPNGTRDAIGARVVFTPMYRQVIAGLDLGVPVGLGYSPNGSRSLALGPGALPANDGGDFTIGLAGVYNNAWNINLQYTHFFGEPDTLLSSSFAEATAPPFTWGQTLRDRDFVSFTVRRSF